ncbi:Methionine aminopeptidase 1A-like protein [Gossypium australe]|uniref:Methionine aminopeptidase n=1 Tax=Gossypium australe TaxID=47621 RepID=A0A5B6UYT3_9ROSI|nr:Methionine aminopeptidase 1A-like protein [Gossypium australe]
MAGGSDAAETLSCARCSNPASLLCPKCVELKLPREGAAFCTQDCFKASWSSHKSVHLKAKLSSLGTDGAGGQNSDLASEGWLYCLRKGQSRTPKLPPFNWTGTLRPYPISVKRNVPAHIDNPDWANDGVPKVEPNSDWQHRVEIKTPDQIERMRETCRIAREVLDAAARMIRPGVTTDEIDRVVHEATVAAGAYPSPLNYHFFPKSCCTSVNEVICHGIPDARKLEDGDIINVDVTVYYKGVHGDLNETYFVGNVDEASRKLVQCTYECLDKAISIVKPGVRFRDVGEVINRHASMSGLSVVKSYCGHGIGELFHCAPNIPHYGSILVRSRFANLLHFIFIFNYPKCFMENCGKRTLRGFPWYFYRKLSTTFNDSTAYVNCFLYLLLLLTQSGNKAVGVMKAGQTFTIEPMINAGVWRDQMWPDGWTAVTADGKRSAQFEHTLLVTSIFISILFA